MNLQRYPHLKPILKCGLYGLKNNMERLLRMQADMEMIAGGFIPDKKSRVVT